MIDTQIESEPRFPLGAAFWGFSGAILLAVGVASQESGWMIASIPCWPIAMALFVARQRGFSARVTEEGLEMIESAQFVRYDAIDSLIFTGVTGVDGLRTHQQCSIQVCHDSGTLVIPANINVASSDLFDVLRARFEPRDVFPLNQLLADFADEQEATFGEDKVHRFTARREVRPISKGRKSLRAVGIGMMLGSIGWGVVGSMHHDGWLGGAIALFAVGIGCLLLGYATSRSPTAHVKNWQESGLVIGPVGFALVQGPLKGKMRWDELRDIKFNPGAKPFRMSSGAVLAGIFLQVEGSSLVIADFYNQPLNTIHDRLIRYWQGDRSG